MLQKYEHISSTLWQQLTTSVRALAELKSFSLTTEVGGALR